ncbi:hypothetical protein Tco_1308919 [Tanacetum coccineum]
MGAKDCCLMGLRKKRCGANWNEGGLSKEGYGARWKLMKVVLGVVVAAAEVGQQGHHQGWLMMDKVVPADYVPADYVSAGHVPVPADRDRIC